MSTAITTLDSAILHDLDTAIQREWLVTNGTGGYASGTVTGINTRRYHGLLVAALDPPLGRSVMLAKVDEVVSLAGQTYELGANEFHPNVIHPQGFATLESVRLEGQVPTFCYRVGNAILEKRIWMAHGRNTTYVRYTHVAGDNALALRVRLFTAQRDFHSLMRGSDEARPEVTVHDASYATVTSHQIEPPLSLLCSEGAAFELQEKSGIGITFIVANASVPWISWRTSTIRSTAPQNLHPAQACVSLQASSPCRTLIVTHLRPLAGSRNAPTLCCKGPR